MAGVEGLAHKPLPDGCVWKVRKISNIFSATHCPTAFWQQIANGLNEPLRGGGQIVCTMSILCVMDADAFQSALVW